MEKRLMPLKPIQSRITANRGFSLLEMVIVVVVLAIITAIAQPRYAAAVSRYRASAAAQRIAADLSLAQAKARYLSTSRVVVFTVATSTYQLTGEADLSHPASTYTITLSDKPYKATLVSVNFAGAAQVTFNGYGVPNSGGTIVVSAGNATNTITIDADTGVATIQ